jgi:geranylgeranyl diphosphate synthase type II
MTTERERSAALETEMRLARERVDARLETLLEGGPPTLIEAMRYAVLSGGKRLRPILCLWTHDLLRRRAVEPVLDVACALEFVHTYSLVHDDLPCMDDDALRRGRPACHVQFGEAIAVLAGDALLNVAYETILGASWSEPARALRCARVLADAASHRQLVGGQVLDLQSEGVPPTPERLTAIHSAKTGALLRAAVLCGAVSAGASNEEREKLGRMGHDLGLAFQIVDDVLDVVAASSELGKTAGKDAGSGKATYPALYGVQQARQHARHHIERACETLSEWPTDGRLRALARYIETRMH